MSKPPLSALAHLGTIIQRSDCPGIGFLPPQLVADLLPHNPQWLEQIAELTHGEKHLLEKAPGDLSGPARAQHMFLAIEIETMQAVGCVILWELGDDERDEAWFELGTYVVHTDWRYGASRMPIGTALFEEFLEHYVNENVMLTTTNPSVMHACARSGLMTKVSFHDLSLAVHEATCICPFEKIGQTCDRMRCPLGDRMCWAAVNTRGFSRLSVHP